MSNIQSSTNYSRVASKGAVTWPFPSAHTVQDTVATASVRKRGVPNAHRGKL